MNESNYERIEYVICRPGGNDTALVYGLQFTLQQKKQINNEIMKKYANIEQVGFIDLNKKPQLEMAGGEFCGNATRSAVNCYLHGKKGNIKITVNSSDLINGGIDENGRSWCEIPLYYGDDAIIKKEEGTYLVKMKGMITIVIESDVAKKYLRNTRLLKAYAMEFIDKYHLQENDAVGVMFCEYQNNILKINPVVWVKSINTLFYESACGSGTTATCMVEAYKNKANQKINILQPSGCIITANITFEKNKVIKAVISGYVTHEQKMYVLKLKKEAESKNE